MNKLSRSDQVWFGLCLLGGAMSLGAGIGFHGRYTVTKIALDVAGSVLVLASILRNAVRLRQRFHLIAALLISFSASYGVAKDLARSQAHTDLRVAVACICFAFFVLPMVGVAVIWRRFQDELERSVGAMAGAATLVLLLVASVGYWVLERAIDLPAVPSIWFAVIGAGVWVIVWFVLSRRYA